MIWEVALSGEGAAGERFETTDDHPWWIVDESGEGQWLTTEELSVGMVVITRQDAASDGQMVIDQITETTWTDATYYLTVADFHTYFVGDQRVLVHNCGPKPNGGIARPHGGPAHNGAIDKRADALQADPGVTNIRKNQAQVDVNGTKVGNNRPDIQYDKDGCHHCVEYDTRPANGQKHGEVIRNNDPDTKIELNDVN